MTQETVLFQGGASQVIEVTIPAGETESAAFDIGSASAVGFILDGAAFSGQHLAVLVAAAADGPFYPAMSSSGVALSIAAPADSSQVRTLSPTEFSTIAPFRFLKLQSDAPTAGLTVDDAPVEVFALVDDPLLVGAVTLTATLSNAVGFIYPGDTFTIEGDATVYTVTAGAEVGADNIAVTFTPPVAFEAAAGSDVTFDQTAVRGEQLDRVFQVVTKD